MGRKQAQNKQIANIPPIYESFILSGNVPGYHSTQVTNTNANNHAYNPSAGPSTSRDNCPYSASTIIDHDAYHSSTDAEIHDHHHYGPTYKYKSSSHAPLKRSRSCTDVICLLLFIAFLGCWIFVAYLTMRTGDIRKVLFPTDSHGQICGQGSLISRPYLLIFDLSQCLSPSSLIAGCPTPHVCVSQCPQENYSPSTAASLLKEDQLVIKDKIKPFCKPGLTELKFRQKTVEDLIQSGDCPPWYLASSPVLGRCLPGTSKEPKKNLSLVGPTGEQQVSKGDLNIAITRLAGVFSLRQLGEKVFSDLLDTWWIIGLALVGATILSFIWIVLLRLMTCLMIWLSILAILSGLVCLLAYCSYRLYFILVSSDPATRKSILSVSWTPYYMDDVLELRDTWLAFTSILGIVLLVLLLLLLILRKRIFLAISLIEEAGRAIGQTLSSLVFPIIPFSMQVVVSAWFLTVAAFIATSSDQEYRVILPEDTDCSLYPACHKSINVSYQQSDLCSLGTFSDCKASCQGAACQFVKYNRNRDYSLFQIVNVFGLFWALFFCSSFSELVLARVFSHWYWKRGVKKFPSVPVLRAVFYTIAYHLGTVAFGSLVIAVIRMIRLVLDYVEKKCRKLNNEIGRCVLCFCKACLWCLEKFMRFINRNAFIMCAVNGTNFCKSAKDAFNLITRNFVRIVVLNSVCDFLLFIGKVFIIVACGSVSYLAFGGYIPHIRDDIPALNYFFIPCVFIVIGSYLIATAFFSVYSMAVDTLFLCFLEDLERNDGSLEKPYHMSRKLMKILGRKN